MRVAGAVALLSACFWMVGCGDDVELGNQDPYVTFVGPSEWASGQVTTWFGVGDAEGDLASARVEVCPEGGACFEPEILSGSSSLGSLPTTRHEEAAPLKVVWRADCSKIAADASFDVKVVLGEKNPVEGSHGPVVLQALSGEENPCAE